MTKLNPDLRALVRNDVRTAEQLWQVLSANPDGGLNDAVRPPLLGEAMIPRAAIEALRDDKSPGKLIRDHWLGVLLVGTLLLLGLWVGLLPRERAVIAAGALKANSAIGPGDVDTAWLPTADHTFSDSAQLTGFVVAHDIAPNTPLRYEDVLRPQVLASRDIPSGTVLSRDTISVTWSTYQPNGIPDIAAVLGRPVLRPIQSGRLVQSDALADAQALKPQVIVSLPAGLPANHVILAEEVTLSATVSVPKAISALNDVVGGYLLAAVAAGEAVRADQVVRPPLLAGKKIGQVGPVRLTALSPQIGPGEPVSLWFYPRDSAGASVVAIDAVVLALSRHDQDVTLTVAASESDLMKVLPLTGKVDVFAVQAGP